jgi:putative endonuclease
MPAPSLLTTAARGAYGERLAAAFLWRLGYRTLHRNYRTERGELDLICREGSLLIFVEVRTRNTADFGLPSETIGAEKQEALRYAAASYLHLLRKDDIHYRFDAVEVILVEGKVPACTLIRDLFA